MRFVRRLSRLLERDVRAIAAAFVLLLTALVLPPVNLPRTVYNHVIFFDISQSMNVEDYSLAGKPVSRLNYARETVRQALRQLPCGSTIGWGAFTGDRALLLLAPVEVCENYDDLLASLAGIDDRMRWANASAVARGVYWSMRVAKAESSHPDVIFVTDGHEAPPLEGGAPIPLFSDLKPGEVRGMLVGAGGLAPRPIPKTDEDGRPLGFWRVYDVVQAHSDGYEHFSALREPYLRRLAEQAGFTYARLTTPDSILDALMDPRFARRIPVPTDLALLPVAAALLLLVWRFRPQRVRR